MKLYLIPHLYGYAVIIAQSKQDAIELLNKEVEIYDNLKYRGNGNDIQEYDLTEGYKAYAGE